MLLVFVTDSSMSRLSSEPRKKYAERRGEQALNLHFGRRLYEESVVENVNKTSDQLLSEDTRGQESP